MSAEREGSSVFFPTSYKGSSFSELLEIEYPYLRPDFEGFRGLERSHVQIPEGTTVLALRYADGVLVAGDRLATAGMTVASRHVQKVFGTDNHSLIAIAGAAGPCIEMAKIMRLELEHYEKIEGAALELEGKANRLSQMIRSNLPAALQGLVVIPLFAGYDRRRRIGRVWKYDITGGRQEEADYESTGSGSIFARESLKKTHRSDASREEALSMAIGALVDASDEDRATGGVDLDRGIFPQINICTAKGIEDVPEAEIAHAYQAVRPRRREGDTP